jgi:general secretion pathway protein A
MYTQFYGLDEKPFALVPDPKYLFLSTSHREALAHLLYGIEEGEGFIQVIGHVGTGKTTLCRTLLQRVGPDVEIAFIFNPSGSELELLAAISREFGLPSDLRSRSELLDQLNRFLLERKATGRRPVLVIDEAQNLEPEVLEQIRLVSNLETEREKLIQIVLIGQPELEDNLSRADMRQLRQRVTVRWSLHPLDRREVGDYLDHRLRVAGLREPDLFTPGAVRAVYRASLGVPRLINAVADRALLAGYSCGTRCIDVRLVREAAKELPLSRPRAGYATLGLPAGVAAILMLGGLVLGLLYTAWDPVRDGGAPALPPVASDATRVGEATAPQPVSLETLSAAQDLERLLVVESSRSSAAAALDALVNVWGYSASLDQEIDPNLFAGVVSEFSSLRVFATLSTKNQLERVNLPAILELELSPGERRYAAVLALEGDGQVLLALGPRSFQVSSLDLDRLWTGRTFFLWTNFESLPALAPGMNGSAVRWLQARLTDLGYLQRGDASGEFDAYTAGAIRRFQTEYALEQTGEVGPDSLIALYQALQYEAPRLTWEKEGS